MGDRSSYRMLACVLLACVMSALPGCRVISEWFAPAERVEVPARTRGELLAEPELAPEGSRRGLEVRLAVVDDTLYAAPRLLSELSAGGGSGIDPDLARRWADWGFRLVSIPKARVEPFLDSLRPVQAGSVQWLGEFGAWRPVVRAGELGTGTVRVGESTRRIERGRPRVIARSWVEPVLTEGGVGSAVRLDLGMQIERVVRRSRPVLDSPGEAGFEEAGPVIDDLLSSFTLAGERALVIVGEQPGVSWADLPQSAGREAADWAIDGDGDGGRGGGGALGPTPDEGEAPGRPERAPEVDPARDGGDRSIEPERPRIKTLGELMLMTEGSRIVRLNEARVVPKRVVVVLIPAARGPFRLLPGDGGRAMGGGGR